MELREVGKRACVVETGLYRVMPRARVVPSERPSSVFKTFSSSITMLLEILYTIKIFNFLMIILLTRKQWDKLIIKKDSIVDNRFQIKSAGLASLWGRLVMLVEYTLVARVWQAGYSLSFNLRPKLVLLFIVFFCVSAFVLSLILKCCAQTVYTEIEI